MPGRASIYLTTFMQNSSLISVNEKRKFPRYGIASIAEISIPDSDETYDAFISSISRGGIGVYSQQKMEIGQDLNVKISFLQTNGNEEITEIIPGRIVWVKEFHGNYVVGIAFATMDSLKHSKILSYIEAAAHGSA